MMQNQKQSKKESQTHPALLGSLSPESAQVINFSPGPTSLPKEVERKIAQTLSKSKISSLAMSHRSPEFLDILDQTIRKVRHTLAIPDNYEILFTHGGGHGQFAAVPLNLCKEQSDIATYVVNGTWSARGRDEALKYCSVRTIDGRNSKTDRYDTFPELTHENIDENSRYVFLCSNETVNGIELHKLPTLPESRRHIPLVVDASSDLSTKPIDWEASNVGVLFACASKNIGHPGVTLTVVRNDLLHNASVFCPGVFNYSVNIKANNVWNTPATFNIEVIGFVFDWLAQFGGVAECEARSIEKSNAIYKTIESSNGFYHTPVSNKQFRSRMNVPFNVSGGDRDLTNLFLKEAWNKGMVGLQTLTPFGLGDYLRASLYNGVSVKEAKLLAEFMDAFAQEHG